MPRKGWIDTKMVRCVHKVGEYPEKLQVSKNSWVCPKNLEHQIQLFKKGWIFSK